MSETLDQRVEAAVAARMRVLTLKQAHERLAKLRTEFKNIRAMLEGEPDFDHWMGRVLVNDIEPLMWNIEQAVIDQKEK